MPYPGWGTKQIDQYRSIKKSIADAHPKMSEDDVQAYAAKIVNNRKTTIRSRRSMSGEELNGR